MSGMTNICLLWCRVAPQDVDHLAASYGGDAGGLSSSPQTAPSEPKQSSQHYYTSSSVGASNTSTLTDASSLPPEDSRRHISTRMCIQVGVDHPDVLY